jgi:hypothetical protein
VRRFPGVAFISSTGSASSSSSSSSGSTGFVLLVLFILILFRFYFYFNSLGILRVFYSGYKLRMLFFLFLSLRKNPWMCCIYLTFLSKPLSSGLLFLNQLFILDLMSLKSLTLANSIIGCSPEFAINYKISSFVTEVFINSFDPYSPKTSYSMSDRNVSISSIYASPKFIFISSYMGLRTSKGTLFLLFNLFILYSSCLTYSCSCLFCLCNYITCISYCLCSYVRLLNEVIILCSP